MLNNCFKQPSKERKKERKRKNPETDYEHSLFNHFRQQMQAQGNVDQEQFLDNLVTQLLEESQQQIKGPPPASNRFIQMLPDVRDLKE